MDFCFWVDPAYIDARHLQLLARKLEQVEKGEIKRLMIFMPPRHGKSDLTSYKFPSWYLGRNPEKRVIHTSYSSSLSNSFSRKIRNLISDPVYSDVFRVSLAPDSRAADSWNLAGHKGGMISSGVGGSITGQGADLFLIDDPIKNREEAESMTHRENVWEWYRSVARTRLEPNGAIVLIMTRWHVDDLAGKILKEHNDWEVLNLPALAEEGDLLGRNIGEALWPERFDVDDLEALKHESGSRNWAALFQGKPKDAETQIIKREWFTENSWYDAAPIECDRFGGIDTATSTKTSADNTAFVDVLKDPFKGYLYVDDVFLEKITVHGFSTHVCSQHCAKKYQAIEIEENAAGEAIKQVIEKDGRENGSYPPIRGFKTSTDKVVRVMRFQHLIENGTLKFKRGNKKVAELVEHLINFDGKGSEIDDDVDALGFAIEAALSGTMSGIFMADWDVRQR